MKGQAGTHLPSVVVVDDHSQDEGCHGPVLSLQTAQTHTGLPGEQAGNSSSPPETWHGPKSSMCQVKTRRKSQLSLFLASATPQTLPLLWGDPKQPLWNPATGQFPAPAATLEPQLPPHSLCLQNSTRVCKALLGVAATGWGQPSGTRTATTRQANTKESE